MDSKQEKALIDAYQSVYKEELSDTVKRNDAINAANAKNLLPKN